MPDTRAERVEAAARALLQHASHRTWDDLRTALALPPDPQPQTGALRELLREGVELVRYPNSVELMATQLAWKDRARKLLAASAPAEPECVTAMRELHRQAAPYRGGGTQACDAWMSKAQDLMRDVVDHSVAGEPAPAEPEPARGPSAEMSARAEFGDDKQCPRCGYSMGPHICTKCGWIPTQPEPVADAERERRVAGGDGYRALDHHRANRRPARLAARAGQGGRVKPHEIERDIQTVWTMMPHARELCPMLRHRQEDRHDVMCDCPAADRLLRAWDRLAEHLRDSIDPVKGKEGA